MKYENYEAVRIADDLSSFDFMSTGKNGNIPKRIIFMPTDLAGIYILAFGSISTNEEIDDHSVSNNGDRNKILATVAAVVDLYSRRYPDRMIYFRGSTKERTRLYRMAVSINLEELSLNFEIYAEIDNQEDFVPFCKDMKINAFLIKRRSG